MARICVLHAHDPIGKFPGGNIGCLCGVAEAVPMLAPRLDAQLEDLDAQFASLAGGETGSGLMEPGVAGTCPRIIR
jgi:hypothetical protein